MCRASIEIRKLVSLLFQIYFFKIFKSANYYALAKIKTDNIHFV